MSQYKPGDRVIALRWPYGGAGIIVKTAPVYPWVRWDGRSEDKRVRVQDIRLETPDDVSRRDHERAVRVWQERMPKTSHVRVTYAPYLGVAVVGVLRAPEAMRAVAAELGRLADWFAEEPAQSPTKTSETWMGAPCEISPRS